MNISPENEILILDFDHTLYLSNSTEEYLNSVKPKFLVSLVLALLDWSHIWKIFPKKNEQTAYRDPIRIICISILFPWSYLLFKARILYLSKKYLNPDIEKIIKSKPWKKVIIASKGFDFIIKPLLEKMEIEVDVILSSSIFPTQNGIRAAGKKNYIQNSLTIDELKKSIFISDNLEDKELKGIVNDFIYYKNPDVIKSKAGQYMYIPFVYTHKSKRGNENHLLNVVLLEDYPFILLAFGFSNPTSFYFLVSILLFIFSFWCIYEVCYYENDLYELNYETKHNNPDKLNYINENKESPFEISAWIWSSILGLSALIILGFESKTYEVYNIFTPELGFNFLRWILFLTFLRLVFRIYTYSPLLGRFAIFPFLQIARLIGPYLFFSINFCGIFFVLSRVFSRWFSYSIYRAGGDREAISQPLIRHIIFIILIATLAIVEKDIGMLISVQIIGTLCFSLIRGHLRSMGAYLLTAIRR